MSVRKLSSASRHAPASVLSTRVLLASAVVLLFVLVPLGLRLLGAAGPAQADVGGNILVLAAPAFLAGALSFLSPCCLPILSAYFALTFQARRERVVLMTIAFFLGLATTLVVLGATATLMSQLLFSNLRELTLVGGLIVIGFGVMSLLGKGFTGLRLLDRPNATYAGSYIYGATFALGWTACVGPILGTVLTLLAAQGVTVLQGAALAFIYALGVGTPLIVTATWWSRLRPEGTRDSWLWRMMRGRGFTLALGRTTLQLHTTSIASGVLLIGMGALLASGQLAIFSRWAVQTPWTQWILSLDDSIKQIFVGR